MKKRFLIGTLYCTAMTVCMSLASPVMAQTAVAAPAAAAIPPTWAQGRTPEQLSMNLVPHPPGIFAMPADEIPTSSLKVPAGFKVELWASGMPNARSMVQTPSGTLFVGTRFPGSVYAVVEKDGKREVKVIAKGLHRPNGVAFKDGSLYVAELSRILRYDNIEANLDKPPTPVVVFDALPKDEAHGWKFMRLSPDGNYLYFQIGTPANITVQPVTHAVIVRLNLKTNILETVAQGVRNSVGMDFHPVTGELWFTNNARDWVSDDLPNDTLHRVTHKGMNFGYPFCHQGDLLDLEFGKGRSCDEFDKPVTKLGPHVAALGMRFYTGKQFPAEYKNNIFIAEHGSWNRTVKTGYEVMRVVLDDKGNVVKKEPFVTGWIQKDDFWGRPADVQVIKDGSLLVSDDVAGAIFRVSAIK
ncbi:Aldose sugar dehydrogenase YliI [Polaromonas vacuolata]|uniref:Aldose sugar dehydrogenase YliI n=1 Tax=Polaromonas vacuolata TaxID=37448 RepID=A0A6H2H7H9_9BURK|nr:PQQ-dependent sugar dehydrogenase [Polaromonas vacuolata]QJC55717.1 Aldose sugar dehydrogenase YliI [Polaromonas vacuolata]